MLTQKGMAASVASTSTSTTASSGAISTICGPIRSILRDTYGLYLTLAGIQQGLDYLTKQSASSSSAPSSSSRLSPDATVSAEGIHRWSMDQSLKDIGDVAFPPEYKSGGAILRLIGKRYLQVVSCRNITTPELQHRVNASPDTAAGTNNRMLGIVLSDGHHRLNAVEHAPISTITESKLLPGTKLLIGEVIILHGVMLLTPSSILAGPLGRVERLLTGMVIKERVDAQRAFLSSLQPGEEPPPAFESITIVKAKEKKAKTAVPAKGQQGETKQATPTVEAKKRDIPVPREILDITASMKPAAVGKKGSTSIPTATPNVAAPSQASVPPSPSPAKSDTSTPAPPAKQRRAHIQIESEPSPSTPPTPATTTTVPKPAATPSIPAKTATPAATLTPTSTTKVAPVAEQRKLLTPLHAPPPATSFKALLTSPIWWIGNFTVRVTDVNLYPPGPVGGYFLQFKLVDGDGLQTLVTTTPSLLTMLMACSSNVIHTTLQTPQGKQIIQQRLITLRKQVNNSPGPLPLASYHHLNVLLESGHNFNRS
jgi:hypothetical protein